MSKLRVNAFTVSADGFGAGPDQGLTNRWAAAANSCTSGSFQPARSSGTS